MLDILGDTSEEGIRKCLNKLEDLDVVESIIVGNVRHYRMQNHLLKEDLARNEKFALQIAYLIINQLNHVDLTEGFESLYRKMNRNELLDEQGDERLKQLILPSKG